MIRTHTPTLEEISDQQGERYYSVSVGRRHRPHDIAVHFGTLEDIVCSMEATIYHIDPDADDLDAWSASISDADTGRPIVIMPDCTGPDSAQVVPQPIGDSYEIRQIDAYIYDDDWTYNATYNLGTFTTASADVPRAFRRALARLGIVFRRGATRTDYDGDLCEIVDRATGEPLFVAIPTA